MALLTIEIANADVSRVTTAIVAVNPARSPSEAAMTPARLANRRIRDWIRDQVEEHERRTLHAQSLTTAKAIAAALVLTNPEAAD